MVVLLSGTILYASWSEPAVPARHFEERNCPDISARRFGADVEKTRSGPTAVRRTPPRGASSRRDRDEIHAADLQPSGISAESVRRATHRTVRRRRRGDAGADRIR